MIILIIASIYIFSCFFEKSDYDRMKDAEKLPPFSKKDAEMYYVELKKLNLQENDSTRIDTKVS
jgi:hypothetical protein